MERNSLQPLKEWFGYTRRERRSSLILILIIAAVAGIRFIVPNRKMAVEIIPLADSLFIADTVQTENTVARTQKYQPKKNPVSFKKIDLNKCDSADLESLPGLGPVLSARIVRYRNLLGGYADVSQLKEVYGLPAETVDRISGMLIVDPADIRMIKINQADYRQLIRLPYFTRYEVNAVLKYRELKGKVENIGELVKNGVIDSAKVSKVKWYLEFRE